MVTRKIRDPEVQLVASIAHGLQDEYLDTESDPWIESPFAWIKTRPSRQRGKIGEQLLAGWCAARDLDVTKSPDSDADRIIEGKRVEIKFSTEWKSGVYKFQQIRDQHYETLICLGLRPFNAHCWVIPKALLYEHVIGHTPQHTGRGGTDTYWLSFPVSSPPSWLAACGGTLRDARKLLL